MTDLPEELQDELVAALKETWRVLRAAGTLNLSNGVQLGPTVWYVKISDAERMSDAVLAKLPPPIDPDIEEARKLNNAWAMGPRLEGPLNTIVAAIKRGRELERASQ